MKLFLILLLSSNLCLAANVKSLVDLEGKPAQFSKKSKLLVVFWATWCDECRSKLNQELVQWNARSDLSVITVNTDRDLDRAKEFVAKEKIKIPVYRDNDKELRKELKVFSVPHWAFYQKNGDDFKLVKSEGAFVVENVLKAVQ